MAAREDVGRTDRAEPTWAANLSDWAPKVRSVAIVPNYAALNLGALTVPVSRAEVKQFRRTSRAKGVDWAQAGSILLIAMVTTTLAALVLFWVIGSVSSLLAGDGTALAPVFGFTPVLALAAVVGLVLFLAIRVAGGNTWLRWLRLTRFAEANGLHFAPNVPGPDYPGTIFGVGTSRRITEHLYRSEGRNLDLGNYVYTTGSGKQRQVHRWGYLALKLDRTLPHMVLDARDNNSIFGFSNLPTSFDRNQVLSLEGDFDRYFTLYCPRQYERDALYVFTPDLMALLIDQTAHFDVEIIDDWLFAYSASALKFTDPGAMAHLFRIIDTVGERTLARTDRYADYRMGDRSLDRVAPAGRRLRRSVPAVMIAAIAFIAVVFGLNFLSLVSSLL